MKRYDPKTLEPKWRKKWEEDELYKADLDSDKPKYLAMSMFNYPSGAGIHIGHAMNYTISDVKARFKRQAGYESYHPIGWDAFGLPAENYAIKAGVSPQASMAKIIPSYHEQYKAIGWSNDWSKEIATHEPEYYKWTQWIFVEMYKQGLAYQDARMQWWCDQCQTVLANEQIVDGKCWRHDGPDDPEVTQKEVKQWFFKITEYADELLEAIDDLDWTDSVKLAQKNWIGRSQGAEVDFKLEISENTVKNANFVFLHGFEGNSKSNFWPKLKKQLEKRNADVFAPDLPNTVVPNADEQAEFVLKNYDFNENSVIIGHSYGVVTGLKILEKLNISIAKFVSVSGFAEPGFLDTERNFEKTTKWDFDFEKIRNKVREFKFLRPKNDSAVPPERAIYLRDQLGGEIFDFIAEADHACGVNEPFIYQTISKDSSVRVFTTRPDTLFGATFMVLAPEHDLVSQITTDEQKAEVDKYITETQRKTEIERLASKEKTGVFTGAYAINPVNDEKIPIWIADYVLTGYGTGAIMAVPAHDERDYDFAKNNDLPIKTVVEAKFITDSGEAAIKDEEFIKRNAVTVMLYDPKTDKYLCMSWKTHKLNGLITGGIEDGEDIVETAKREILEETGYKNIKFIENPEIAIHCLFYHRQKKQNRWARFQYIFFELENDERVKVDEKEAKLLDIVWQPREKLEEFFTVVEGTYILDYLDTKKHIFSGEGIMVNSGEYNDMDSSEAREKIVEDLAKKGLAKEKVNYKMRDWSVSRQRYWGAPIPIIYCEKDGTVLDENLPVTLPELDDFAPSGDGRSALARATDWLNVDCPKCGGQAQRETDTLDTYICSSWYFLRYIDPHNDNQAFSKDLADKWMPVDFYNGGDHATAHMLYARFVTRFFAKQGLLNEPEPFKQFLFNGKVRASDGSPFSKSKGNGVDPLEIIDQGYGADALRTYLMFMAPLEFNANWDPQGVPGTYRFLNRLFTLVQEYLETSEVQLDDKTAKEVRLATHSMIKKVSEDIEENRYNTAISALMKCVNDLYKLKTVQFGKCDEWNEALRSAVVCVAPFAPYVAEELWHDLGNKTSIHKDSWPVHNPEYLTGDQINIVVQINGKLRANIMVDSNASEEEVIKTAKAEPKVATHLDDQTIKRQIYINGKLVNFVI